MRRHHTIPLDHPVPDTTEPNPSSLRATRPETQPSENPRIIAGEIIGWRLWKLCDGFLHSVYVSHLWRPGAFERASCKEYGPENLGYHAFKIREQAEHQAIANIYDSIAIIGSVAMWGEVIEHERGWRSEYAAVRSIIKIIGDVSLLNKQCLLVELREKYRCPVVTEL